MLAFVVTCGSTVTLEGAIAATWVVCALRPSDS